MPAVFPFGRERVETREGSKNVLHLEFSEQQRKEAGGVLRVRFNTRFLQQYQGKLERPAILAEIQQLFTVYEAAKEERDVKVALAEPIFLLLEDVWNQVATTPEEAINFMRNPNRDRLQVGQKIIAPKKGRNKRPRSSVPIGIEDGIQDGAGPSDADEEQGAGSEQEDQEQQGSGGQAQKAAARQSGGGSAAQMHGPARKKAAHGQGTAGTDKGPTAQQSAASGKSGSHGAEREQAARVQEGRAGQVQGALARQGAAGGASGSGAAEAPRPRNAALLNVRRRLQEALALFDRLMQRQQ